MGTQWNGCACVAYCPVTVTGTTMLPGWTSVLTVNIARRIWAQFCLRRSACLLVCHVKSDELEHVEIELRFIRFILLFDQILPIALSALFGVRVRAFGGKQRDASSPSLRDLGRLITGILHGQIMRGMAAELTRYSFTNSNMLLRN